MVRIRCHFGAPSPSAPSRYPSGTVRSARCVFRTMRGSTIRANVAAPLSREYPIPSTSTKSTMPKSPKITEGIPARVSVANSTDRTNMPVSAYSFRYTAAPTPTGTATAKVSTMTYSVFTRLPPMPTVPLQALVTEVRNRMLSIRKPLENIYPMIPSNRNMEKYAAP